MIRPTNKKFKTEKQRRDWDKFLHALSGAIRLAGGVGDEKCMEEIAESRLIDVYDHLYLNKIKFVLTDKSGDRVFG